MNVLIRVLRPAFVLLLGLTVVVFFAQQLSAEQPWPKEWVWTSSGILPQSYKMRTPGYEIPRMREYMIERYGAFPDVVFWEPDSGGVNIAVSGVMLKCGNKRIYQSGMWPSPDITYKTMKDNFFWWMKNVETGDTLVSPIVGLPDTMRIAQYFNRDYMIKFSRSVPGYLFPLPKDTSVYECRILISSEPEKPGTAVYISKEPLYCLYSPIETAFDSLFWYQYANESDNVPYTKRMIDIFPTYSALYFKRYSQLADTDSLNELINISREILFLEQTHLNKEWEINTFSERFHYELCTKSFYNLRMALEAKAESLQNK